MFLQVRVLVNDRILRFAGHSSFVEMSLHEKYKKILVGNETCQELTIRNYVTIKVLFTSNANEILSGNNNIKSGDCQRGYHNVSGRIWRLH
jgi:hypothetical protein